ncbi:hypothetical protein [Mycobacterium sp. 155]|uniref:hypothetical protein n=1 Tax=Mycobacterium sp. 155 TaxID=1157943 RepID=UPI0006856A57|nr:hypothetical protein [Mycobacterium sp. 155]
MTEKRLDKPGFVVVRWGTHGAAYIRLPIYAVRDAALAALINETCELVVAWKGTDTDTLAGISEHSWSTARKH